MTRVAIVHGYFLHDSGSAVYTRELARELVLEGHDVTLVCQERSPEKYDFIDSVFDLDDDNSGVSGGLERKRLYTGSCRLVRPNLHGRLLTYVAGPFPGFEATPFQDAPDDRVDDYITANTSALETVFAKWPQDLVQAGHAVMQPLVVRRALKGSAPYVVTIHGSELNFTIREDPRMVPYAVEGLVGAVAIGALSRTSHGDVVDFFAGMGLDISDKTVEMPPGVDTKLFQPGVDRARVLGEISSSIDPERDDVAVFAGRLLWTKGPQYVIGALPLILRQRPNFQLIVVGDGPLRTPLEAMIEFFDKGPQNVDANVLGELPKLLVPEEYSEAYGDAVPKFSSEKDDLAYDQAARGNMAGRVHFTGHLAHDRLAPLLAAADISLAPSVFPEAFGLVSIEAMAAGAIPVATYQTGLKTPLDAIADELDDDGLKSLKPGVGLACALAGLVANVLEEYPTQDLEFRTWLHELAARRFSWKSVAQKYLTYAERSGE